MTRKSDSNLSRLRDADEAARCLTIYAGVVEDAAGSLYRDLLDRLTPHSQDPVGTDQAAETGANRPSILYRRLYALLAAEMESARHPIVGDAWQDHLLDRILGDDNPFSRKIDQVRESETDEPMGDESPDADDGGATGGSIRLSETIVRAVEADLRELSILFRFSGDELREAVQRREPDARNLPSFEGFGVGEPLNDESPRTRLKHRFADCVNWMELLPDLVRHIRKQGLGIFRDHIAFRWESGSEGGRLIGIDDPDPVRMEDLVGNETERELLRKNAEHFLAGYPANNVLLYGDRGTGKSSTVKAQLNEYCDRGLRMVEVQKEDLSDFPQIIRLLKNRRERFLLFIDDLSFEEHESHYKGLKALLEGSLEARPENMLLYATSNRRHLVRERFSDRDDPGDAEIHRGDTTEEKLSLSDRFGLTLTYPAPTQKGYLTIIRDLANRRGIDLPDSELRSRALEWSTIHGTRNGRTARQFMDFLTAEMALRRQEGVGGTSLDEDES